MLFAGAPHGNGPLPATAGPRRDGQQPQEGRVPFAQLVKAALPLDALEERVERIDDKHVEVEIEDEGVMLQGAGREQAGLGPVAAMAPGLAQGAEIGDRPRRRGPPVHRVRPGAG